MLKNCVKPGCFNNTMQPGPHTCASCTAADHKPITDADVPSRRSEDIPLSEKYPKYYKKVIKELKELDTYAVNMMFPVDDPSGAILHARKKLLVPGVRTGGKTMIDDVREARDTLTRWLQLNT